MEQQQQKKPGIVRRAAVGVGKAWAYSLGFTSLIRTSKRIGGRVAGLAGYVWRELRKTKSDYRHETFQEAIERLGLDEAHLVRQARIFHRQSLIWLMLAIFCAGLQLFYALNGALTVRDLVLTIGFEFMTLSKMLANHFRFCEIRDQEHYSFGPWFWSLGGRW
jgi:hypothetical protein